MKLILSILVAFPLVSFADCPYQIEFENTTYCLDIQWETGESKFKGKFKAIQTQTPHLIPMGEVPPKWVYSQATIKTWAFGDQDETPIEVPGLRVFPYMLMLNGKSHSAGYEYIYDKVDQVSLLRRVAFQKMHGCWTLRWTTDPEDLEATSNHLATITDFFNLSQKQVDEQIAFCEGGSEQKEHTMEHGTHHHKHH